MTTGNEMTAELVERLFEGSYDSIAIHDLQGRFLDVNPAFCKDLGLSREKILGQSIHDIHPAEHVDALRARMDQVLRQGSAEYTCYHTDVKGNVIPVASRAYRITHNGEPAILTLCANRKKLHETEEELVRALNLQRSVVDNIPIGIWVGDTDFTVRMWNPGQEQMTGVAKEEVLGKNVFQRFPSLAEHGLEQAYRRVVETGEPLQLPEMHFSDPTLKKQDYYLNIRANPLRNREGDISGILVVVEDITQAVRADRQLRATQAERRQLDEIIRYSPVIAFRWRNAPGWPVEYVSQNIESELGYEPKAFLSGEKAFSDIVHPDDIDRVVEEVHTHLERNDDDFTQTYRLLSRSGGTHWFDDRTWVQRDPDGRVTHLHGILVDITDRQTMEQAVVSSNEELATANEELSATNEELLSEITERTRAEEALRESEERFRAVFESSKDCILVWDRDYKYIYANQAAIDHVSASPEDVIGKSIREGLGHIPAFMQTWMARVDQVFDTSQPMRVEDHDVIHGRNVYSESVLFPIHNAAGEMVYVGVIYRDITERKQAELMIRHQARNDAVINDLLHSLLGASSLKTISDAVLKHALELTESTIGYAGYIDPSTGYLVCPTMAGEVWDRCNVEGKSMVFQTFSGLWGWSLNERKPIRTNKPDGDPRSSGVPAGHIGIQRFLAAPALAGSELIGQLAVANASRDYSEEDQALLERLATIYALAVLNTRQRDYLQASEARYRSLFESAADATFLMTDVFLDCNEAACKLWKCSREDIIGHSPAEFSPPNQPDGQDSMEAARQRIQRARSGEDLFFDWMHRDKQGNDLDCEVALTVVSIDGAERVLATVRDVTERKQAERQREHALAEARQRTRETTALFDAARAVMGSKTFEQAARTIFDIAKDITGATSGYVALLSDDGAENTILFLDAGGRPCSVDPELPMPIRGLRAEAYKHNQTVYDNEFPASEWMDYMPEGHVRLDNVLFAPLVVTGQAVGLIGLANKPSPFTDTDAHIAQALGEMAAIALVNARNRESLRASEARYRSLFESAADATFLMTDIVHDCNEAACRLCKCSREDIIGRSPDDFSPPTQPDGEESSHAAQRRIELAQAGKPQQFYWIHRNARGEDIECEVALTAVTVEGNERVLATVRDISERRRAEQERRHFEAQIQHAQKLESLGVLAGGIAHDFNNLLTSILGNTELAGMDLSPGSPIRAYLDEIKRASIHASELCNQMLAYSGKGKFVIQAIDLNELVGEMAHLLRTSISKKVQLCFDFQDDLASVEGDPTQLRQVVMNLITNASDAIGDDNGAITIRTETLDLDEDTLRRTYLQEDLAQGPHVVLAVTDTGCGMDEETLGKLFDPFFTTKFTGRGLGLAAVMGIVRGHHGAIRIDSTPGEGTTFEILLPISDKPLQTSPDTPADTQEWTGQGTVLLVDDEQSVLALGERMLRRLGFDVLTASDGQEALDVFDERDGTIDFVLLDMTMPKLSGDQVFAELRKRRPDLPVLLASGYTQQEAHDRFDQDDLAGFIQKPYRFDQLRGLIRDILVD